MKTGIFLSVVLLASASGQAMAACSGAQVVNTMSGWNTIATAQTLLAGKTVCIPNGAGGWKHQDFHQTGGVLIDYKRGPGHSVDPSKQVGSWNVTGTGALTRVNYTYGSTTYGTSVFDLGGGSYCFSNGATDVTGTIKTGQSACP